MDRGVGEPHEGQYAWQELREYERLLRERNDLLARADDTQKDRLGQLEKQVGEQRARLEGKEAENRGSWGYVFAALHKAPVEELTLAMRRYERYLRDVPIDLDDSHFKERRRFLTEAISDMQEEMDRRVVIQPVEAAAVPLTAVEEAVAQATSAAEIKAEIILGLMQACEEKKKKYPEELHGVLDREYRKAIDKIRRES